MHKLSVYILVGYKLVYNHSGKYLTQSNGIYYPDLIIQLPLCN